LLKLSKSPPPGSVCFSPSFLRLLRGPLWPSKALSRDGPIYNAFVRPKTVDVRRALLLLASFPFPLLVCCSETGRAPVPRTPLTAAFRPSPDPRDFDLFFFRYNFASSLRQNWFPAAIGSSPPIPPPFVALSFRLINHPFYPAPF